MKWAKFTFVAYLFVILLNIGSLAVDVYSHVTIFKILADITLVLVFSFWARSAYRDIQVLKYNTKDE